MLRERRDLNARLLGEPSPVACLRDDDRAEGVLRLIHTAGSDAERPLGTHEGSGEVRHVDRLAPLVRAKKLAAWHAAAREEKAPVVAIRKDGRQG